MQMKHRFSDGLGLPEGLFLDIVTTCSVQPVLLEM